jgi:ATPase
MPVGEIEGKRSGMWALASGVIRKEIQKYTSGHVEVMVTSDSSATVFMNEDDIAGVIGKGGKTIDQIEKKLGVHLDVREREKMEKKMVPRELKKEKTEEITSFVPHVERSKKHVILTVLGLEGETVEVFCGEDYLFTATVGLKGDIKLGKDKDEAYRIMEDPSIVTLRRGTGE